MAEPGHNSSAASHTVRTPSGRKQLRPASARTAKVSNLASGCPAAPVRPGGHGRRHRRATALTTGHPGGTAAAAAWQSRAARDRTRSSVITARAAASFEPVGTVGRDRPRLRPRHPPGLGLRRHRRRRRRPHQRTGHQRRGPRRHRRRRPVPAHATTAYASRSPTATRSARSRSRAPAVNIGSPDREGGRGLLLCAALAARWGVEYTPTHKQVWFQLDLPERPVGTRSAGPVAARRRSCPLADGRVRVAVVQIDRAGSITAWNEDAEELFGYAAEQVIGKPLTDLAAWPHTPGTGTGIAEALQLSRWEGSYGIRGADGRVIPVYASHLRVRDTDGEPSTVCLLVRDDERAVLQTPLRGPPSDTRRATERPAPPTPSRSSSAPPPPTTSTGSSSAPSNAPATCSTATPPSCCSPPTTRPSWRYAPPPACPPPASASPASPSRPAPAATARPACPPSTRTSRPSPAPSRCWTAPACARSSPSRSRSRAASPAPSASPPRPRPLLQRGGPAPPVRRRPHRPGRRVAPASASWNACAAARSPSSSRPPTCSPAPWTATRPWP